MPTASPKARNNSEATETAVPEVMSPRMADAANGVVAIPSQRFSDDDLRAISSFDDAAALLAQNDMPVVAADQVLGNGFAVITEKGNLCGVPLLFLSWNFNNGDNGEFVSAHVIAQVQGMNVPAKFVINDGSTGIYRQLRDYTDKTSKTTGLLVKRGLRRSDYQYDDNGTPKNATTFYLDTSA